MPPRLLVILRLGPSLPVLVALACAGPAREPTVPSPPSPSNTSLPVTTSSAAPQRVPFLTPEIIPLHLAPPLPSEAKLRHWQDFGVAFRDQRGTAWRVIRGTPKDDTRNPLPELIDGICPENFRPVAGRQVHLDRLCHDEDLTSSVLCAENLEVAVDLSIIVHYLDPKGRIWMIDLYGIVPPGPPWRPVWFHRDNPNALPPRAPLLPPCP